MSSVSAAADSGNALKAVAAHARIQASGLRLVRRCIFFSFGLDRSSEQSGWVLLSLLRFGFNYTFFNSVSRYATAPRRARCEQDGICPCAPSLSCGRKNGLRPLYALARNQRADAI